MLVFKNSTLAKILLFEGYSTIMLFGLVFTKLRNPKESTIKHESIHVRQYLEITILSLIISTMLVSLNLGSLTYFILSFFNYYILYIILWLIYSIIYKSFKLGYRKSPLEKEAYNNENNNKYFKLFGWL